mgnify:CR=1 FL=1
MNTTYVQLTGGTIIAAVLMGFAFIGSASAGPLFATTASAGYGGQDKVEICHKGKNTQRCQKLKGHGPAPAAR